MSTKKGNMTVTPMISGSLEITNFSAPNIFVGEFKRRQSTINRNQARSRMLIQKLQKTEKITDYCKKFEVPTPVTNNADETGLFFCL
jgi:hypothetical protein